MCKMKNLTLRIEESTVGKARQIASEHSTSVNALIRDYLNELVSTQGRQAEAKKKLIYLCNTSEAESGERNWTREDLYDR